jgi:adenylate kinase
MDVRLQTSWLLLGPTGAGKSPLGRMLEEKGAAGRRCFHFDFGAEMRAVAEAPEGAADLPPAERQVVLRSLATGALLEDHEFLIALRILGAFLRHSGMGEEDRLVLNGLPRHVGQARMMEDVVRVAAVISLEAGAEIIRERIERNTGGDRVGRVDDELHAVRQKLVLFRMRTLPLIEYYENREVPVVRVPVGARTVAEDMYAMVLELVRKGTIA